MTPTELTLSFPVASLCRAEQSDTSEDVCSGMFARIHAPAFTTPVFELTALAAIGTYLVGGSILAAVLSMALVGA